MFASLITLPLLASTVAALPLGRIANYSPRAESTNTTTSSSGNNGTIAAAWFEGWNADFTPDQVSWEKYTHMTYSFAVTNPDGSLDLSGSGEQAGLTAFVTAAQAKGTKALVSVGGWTGSQYWSTNVATAENRTAFVKTLTDFASTNKLDGLDFDWEYPTGSGMACNQVSPSDTTNYLLFLQEMRKANPDLILTAAAGIAPWKDESGTPSTDVSAFAKELTYVAIMNYDEFGQWSATAGPNSALDDSCAPAADQQGSAVSAVKAWTAAGMPASQLVLGVASYGHAFNVAPSDAYASGSPSSSATATGVASSSAAATATTSDTYDDSYRHRRQDDTASSSNGTLALFPAYSKWQYTAGETPATECGAPAAKDVSYTFAALVSAGYLTDAGDVASGYASTFDSCSQTPFLYDESKQMLVSYDDARAFTAKGQFIQSAGLAGFALWEASGDHNDVLLDAVRAAVGGTTSGGPTSATSTGSPSSAMSNSAPAATNTRPSVYATLVIALLAWSLQALP